jgi:tripartite-type tricarboxylate transporter receptor subunit TctC
MSGVVWVDDNHLATSERIDVTTARNRRRNMQVVGKVILAIATLVASASASVRAQEFPTKPITIIVAYAPGSSSDVFGRYLADSLSKLWKQSVVVENRPGAGGSIGTAHVTKSRPDGHTFLISSNTFTTNAAAQRNLPYDPLKDLQPVSMIARGQMGVVTGSRIAMPTLADVAQQGKAQKLFYGTNGPGSAPTFATELLAERLGVKLEMVNYKGAVDALVDIGGGRLDVYVGAVTTLMPAILNKTAVPVAVLSDVRSKALPEVPTVAEAGFPGAEFDLWWGVFTASGTPSAVAAKINEGIQIVTTTPEGVAFLAKNDTSPTALTVDQFTAHVSREIAQWRDLARRHNLFEE